MQKKIRSLSFNERLFKIAGEISPPFCIQLIVKGNGKIDLVVLKKALLELDLIIPSLSNIASKDIWKNGEEKTRITEYEFSLPDDLNHPIFKSGLLDEEKKLIEIHYFKPCSSILLKSGHMLTDGMGALLVLQYLFKLLRNEKIDPILHFTSDVSFKRKIKDPPENIPILKFNRPGFSNHNLDSNDFMTKLLKFNETIENPAAKCACWLSNELKREIRVLIPVDLRRHSKQALTISNLSSPVYLEISPSFSHFDIQKKILQALFNNDDLKSNIAEQWNNCLPQFIFNKIITSGIKISKTKNKFPLSGFLSDIGRIRLEEFSTSEFSATDFFGLPVYTPVTPFCAFICHHENGTRLAVNIPEQSNDSVILNNLYEFILALSSDKSGKHETASEKTDVDDGQNEIKLRLKEIISCTLNISIHQINITSTFSDLGGDSVGLIELLSEVSKIFLIKNKAKFIDICIQKGNRLTINDIVMIMEETEKKKKL